MAENKLKQWDSHLAQLSSLQRDAYLQLLTASQFSRQLRSNIDPQETTSPSCDGATSSSAYTSPSQTDNSSKFQGFLDRVDSALHIKCDATSRNVLADLKTARAFCTGVRLSIDSAAESLSHLKMNYDAVSGRTNALYDTCEGLLAEQKEMSSFANGFDEVMCFFDDYERINNKLNSLRPLGVSGEIPHHSAQVPVLSAHSSSIDETTLIRIEQSIDFFAKHAEYAESASYLSKYQSCLSRAVLRIKESAIAVLQSASKHAAVRLSEEVSSTTNNAFTMYYGRFRTYAPRFKALTEKLEMRAAANPDNPTSVSLFSGYRDCVRDVLAAYVDERERLLAESVNGSMTELRRLHTSDHCSLLRSGCSLMIHLCEDEINLYSHFFTSPPSELIHSLLETLLNSFYDTFRPLLVHIVHLETLTEICSIIRIEMIDGHVQSNPSDLEAFNSLCDHLLQDAQERLVFRTHEYVRTEILNYSPSPGDVAYPEKLKMMAEIAESIQNRELSTAAYSVPVSARSRHDSFASNASAEVAFINSRVRHFSTVSSQASTSTVSTAAGTSAADMHGMWYPTVKRSLLCLSKLARCLDQITFQGLSQEVIAMCVASLKNASALISSRPKSSELDAQLFLVKHLLIIREQIAPFHADFTVKETALDFSKLKEAASGLYAHRREILSLTSNNALLHFLLEGATPQILEQVVDGKKEVDLYLKRACESLILIMTTSLLKPALEFLKKVDIVREMQRKSGDASKDASATISPPPRKIALRSQTFAKPKQLARVVSETYACVKRESPVTLDALSLYLCNSATEHILFKPVKTSVHQTIRRLQQVIDSEYTLDDKVVINCPSIDQVNLLLSTQSTSTTTVGGNTSVSRIRDSTLTPSSHSTAIAPSLNDSAASLRSTSVEGNSAADVDSGSSTPTRSRNGRSEHPVVAVTDQEQSQVSSTGESPRGLLPNNLTTPPNGFATTPASSEMDSTVSLENSAQIPQSPPLGYPSAFSPPQSHRVPNASNLTPPNAVPGNSVGYVSSSHAAVVMSPGASQFQPTVLSAPRDDFASPVTSTPVQSNSPVRQASS